MTPDVLSKIHRVMRYAEENIYSIDDLLDMKNGELPVPGDVPQRICTIPLEYRVVYSIEQHPGTMAKHISISVGKEEGRFPSIEAVGHIMSLFGFKSDIVKKNVVSGFLAKPEKQVGNVRDNINIFEPCEKGDYGHKYD